MFYLSYRELRSAASDDLRTRLLTSDVGDDVVPEVAAKYIPGLTVTGMLAYILDVEVNGQKGPLPTDIRTEATLPTVWTLVDALQAIMLEVLVADLTRVMDEFYQQFYGGGSDVQNQAD